MEMIRHTQNLFRTFHIMTNMLIMTSVMRMIGLIYYYLTILLKKDGAHDP